MKIAPRIVKATVATAMETASSRRVEPRVFISVPFLRALADGPRRARTVGPGDGGRVRLEGRVAGVRRGDRQRAGAVRQVAEAEAQPVVLQLAGRRVVEAPGRAADRDVVEVHRG